MAAEVLPVCSRCLNPRVISKAGIGTANAQADAKVVAEDAAAWCAVNRPRDKYCAEFEVKQGGDGGRTSFHVSANCETGQLKSLNGGDYDYAGIWPDGPGRGKPMIKDPHGNIPRWEDRVSGTGVARAEWDRFGGLSLSAQWEVLCPGKTPVTGRSAAARVAVAAASPTTAQAPAEAEWLSLCNRCENPNVFSKSGTGSANSVAQARLPGQSKIYRASANCTTGRITTAQGDSYTLAGVWDNSDIGAGRSKWRDASGEIVRRDNASNGLGISQQWEVLCPAPLNASLLAQASAAPQPAVSNALAAQAGRPETAPATRPPAAVPPAASAVPSACTGKRFCDESSSFAAIITDFRPSIYDASTRVVSATVKFLNKTNRPLILGYVRNAGVAIDEQGNRYTLASPESVRGIAEIAGRDFDPKFKVQPGQTADARFEFAWKWNGRDIIGQAAWDVDLTMREVNEVAPGQYRFTQESSLQFKSVPGRPQTSAAPNSASPLAPAGVSSAAGGPGSTTSPIAAAPVTASGPPPAPEPDACGGKLRCYDAGPFVAEIIQASLTHEGNFDNRIARLNVRIRNKTNQPLILAYVARTSILQDNFGNRFSWGSGYDNSATGIGKVESNKADPQFVLQPGETRPATFTVFRRRPPRGAPDGSGYTYEVTIAQLEVLYNGQQVRTTREHVLTFPQFAFNGPSAFPGAAPGTKPPPQSIKETSDALRDIFKKKK
jgi:hypothetical protein